MHPDLPSMIGQMHHSQTCNANLADMRYIVPLFAMAIVSAPAYRHGACSNESCQKEGFYDRCNISFWSSALYCSDQESS